MSDLDLAGLRALAEAATPGPWAYSGYAGIFAPDNGYDAWTDARLDEGHSLDRAIRDPCEPCGGGTCEFHTEDYERDNRIASVRPHHGDTAIGSKAKCAAFIVAADPSVVLALLDRLEAAEAAVADAWDDGWDTGRLLRGPACPSDHNPHRKALGGPGRCLGADLRASEPDRALGDGQPCGPCRFEDHRECAGNGCRCCETGGAQR